MESRLINLKRTVSVANIRKFYTNSGKKSNLTVEISHIATNKFTANLVLADIETNQSVIEHEERHLTAKKVTMQTRLPLRRSARFNIGFYLFRASCYDRLFAFLRLVHVFRKYLMNF